MTDTRTDTDLVGWAIAIISNVDSPEAGWPKQSDMWRTAARAWLADAAARAPLPDDEEP